MQKIAPGVPATGTLKRNSARRALFDPALCIEKLDAEVTVQFQLISLQLSWFLDTGEYPAFLLKLINELYQIDERYLLNLLK